MLKEIGLEPFLQKNFYLSGGTALAGFYLFHRYSEDLGFFSENEVDPMQINIFFKGIQKRFKVKEGQQKFGISIDSLLDIAVNKLFTIYQRCKARDYIDLYCICKKEDLTIGDLIKTAKIKFDWHIDPIQLGTQFLKVTEAKDYPHMIQNLDKKSWQNFFIKEAQKLAQDILK